MAGRKPKKHVAKECVWFCASCHMTGSGRDKDEARHWMAMHFVSDEHTRTVEKLETLALHQKLAEMKQQVAQLKRRLAR